MMQDVFERASKIGTQRCDPSCLYKLLRVLTLNSLGSGGLGFTGQGCGHRGIMVNTVLFSRCCIHYLLCRSWLVQGFRVKVNI